MRAAKVRRLAIERVGPGYENESKMHQSVRHPGRLGLKAKFEFVHRNIEKKKSRRFWRNFRLKKNTYHSQFLVLNGLVRITRLLSLISIRT